MSNNSISRVLLQTRLPVHMPLVLLAMLVAYIALSFVLFPPVAPPDYRLRDFDAFWVTGLTSQSAEPAVVYDSAKLTAAFGAKFPAEAAKRSIGFLYPPPTLLVLAPLAYLPTDLAYVSFCTLSLLALSLFAFFYAGLHGMLFLWGFPALYLCLSFGQLTILLSTFLGIAAVSLAKRPLPAGVFAGLCILKPQLGFLIGLATLGGGHVRAIIIALFTILILCGLSAFFFPGIWPAALTQMLHNAAEPLTNPHWLKLFYSLYAFLVLAGLPHTYAFMLQGLVATGAIILTFYVFRRSRRSEHRLLAIGLLPFWVTPFAYQYDSVLHILALLALLRLSRMGGLMLPEIPALLLVYILPVLPMLEATSQATLFLQLAANLSLTACLFYRLKSEIDQVKS